MTDPLVEIPLRRRHPQTVKNGAFSHKTNYIKIWSDILNIEGHHNCCIGSNVTAILLNVWILPTGGIASAPAGLAAGLFNKNAIPFSPSWVSSSQ